MEKEATDLSATKIPTVNEVAEKTGKRSECRKR